MARSAKAKPAKRASRPNPREARNRSLSPALADPLPNVIRYARLRQNYLPGAGASGTDAGLPTCQHKVELLPRNLAQEAYIDLLLDGDKSVVFAMGPAGCGKTLLATQFAIRELQYGRVDKIVITRPAVSVEEEHGFLPGGLLDKMHPWMLPILDVFKRYYTTRALYAMLVSERIEIAPLAFMRGRTFENAVILADEMQNSTIAQTKMVLTRIGAGSRIVMTGDLQQHDRGYEANGLRDFAEKLRIAGSAHIAVAEFAVGDVERHPVIADILRIYGEA